MHDETLIADTVAITGHRDFTDVGSLYRGLDRTNARQYVFGGARGIDSRALEYIGKTRPGSIRTVVVPNRLVDQPAEARAIIRKYSTHTIELKNRGFSRFQLRNNYMVNRSNAVRAFYDHRPTGGTINTIRYAQRVGKPVHVWSIKTVDMNRFNRMSPDKFITWMKEMRGLKVGLQAIKGIVINFMHNLAGGPGMSYIPEIKAEIEIWEAIGY